MAWMHNKTPARLGEFRIVQALASAPVLKEIPWGKPRHETVSKMHTDLLDIMQTTIDEMVSAKMYYGMTGRTINYRSLAYEQMAQLAVSRLKSTRLIPTVSFARSEDGSYYPSQTHDMQYFSLSGGSIKRVTPLEVKTRLRQKFFDHYKDVGLIEGTTIVDGEDSALIKAMGALNCEEVGMTSLDQLIILQQMTETVIHSIRHANRPDKYGRHCLGILHCGVAKAS